MSPDNPILGIEEKQIAARAADYYKKVSKMLRPYTPSLLSKKMPSGTPKDLLTQEIVGTNWRFVVTRHSYDFVDIEIRRYPRVAGNNTADLESLRIRPLIEPFVRYFGLTKERGSEMYENENIAYERADRFLAEIGVVL